MPDEDIKMPLQYLFEGPVVYPLPLLRDSVSKDYFGTDGVDPCGKRTIELVTTNDRSASQLAREQTAP